MENQTPSIAATPVNPSGIPYIPPPTPPNEPILVQPPVEMPPSKGRSWMIIAGILVVLILLSIGGYMYYLNIQKMKEDLKPIDTVKTLPTLIPTVLPTSSLPMASDSADWNTYTNTPVGFEIKYPASFTKPQIPGGIGPDLSYADGTEDKTTIIFNGDTTSYEITVFPFSGTLEDLLKQRKLRAATSDNQLPTIFPDIPLTLEKSIIIDGEKANWYNNGFENGTQNTTQEVEWIHNNYGFIFRAGTSGKISNPQEMQKIVSSFKFTNQNQEISCDGLSEQACSVNQNCVSMRGPSCPTCTDMKFIECREKVN